MKKTNVLKIVGNIFFYGALCILIFIAFTMIKAKSSGKQPEVFGYKFFVILTGSMSPNINPGDLVIVKDVPIEEIKSDDIITFSSSTSKNITTHRVKEVARGNEISFITQGDANNIQDPLPVPKELVIGKVINTKHKLGTVMKYIQEHLIIIAISIFVMVMVIGFTLKKLKKKSVKQI